MKNEELQTLLNCPKVISEKPKKAFSVRQGSEHNDFKLISIDNNELNFRVFMRKNSKFSENFSVGLEYIVKGLEDDIKLVRFNGVHKHINKIINDEKFETFHVHTVTQQAIEEGLKPESYAIITEEYKTFEEALILFWKRVNIQDDIHTYFPYLNDSKYPQLKLIFEEKGRIK